MTALARWYLDHGRHELAWRATRDRWAILVSEVMLAQTQVARVEVAWPAFMAEFPDPPAMAAAPLGAVVRAWGRLGYPRRARRLWDAAVVITRAGWPDDLTELPGIGRYTAGAVRAQADGDPDAVAVDVNVKRVVQRVRGHVMGATEAERAAVALAHPLVGRDRLLALMDLGATVCTARLPECARCPIRRRCATRGPLDGESPRRQAPYEGSARQRRGQVLARLRSEHHAPVGELDADAVASLVTDLLVVVRDGVARLADE